LTDPKDKLPALSSISEYLGYHLKDDYLAGLWEKKLAYQLCWHPQGPNWTRETFSTAWLTRNSEWRAPSWSFLSVDGPIEFVKTEISLSVDGFVDLAGNKIDIQGESKNSSMNLGIRLIRYAVLPLTKTAPYARLQWCHLDIKGRILQVNIEYRL
jgi:hypothetical protein